MDAKEKEAFYSENSPPLRQAIAKRCKMCPIPYFFLEKRAIQAFNEPCAYPVTVDECQVSLQEPEIPSLAVAEAWNALVAAREPYDAQQLILFEPETVQDYIQSGEWTAARSADGFDDEHRFFWMRDGTVMSGNYASELLLEGPVDARQMAEALAGGQLPEELARPLLPSWSDPRGGELGREVTLAIVAFRKEAAQAGLTPKESNQMLMQVLHSFAPEQSKAQAR